MGVTQAKKKRKEKATPFSINLMRSQVLYQAQNIKEGEQAKSTCRQLCLLSSVSDQLVSQVGKIWRGAITICCWVLY